MMSRTRDNTSYVKCQTVVVVVVDGGPRFQSAFVSTKPEDVAFVHRV